MRGAIPLLPNMSSWRAALLSTGTTLPLNFTGRTFMCHHKSAGQNRNTKADNKEHITFPLRLLQLRPEPLTFRAPNSERTDENIWDYNFTYCFVRV